MQASRSTNGGRFFLLFLVAFDFLAKPSFFFLSSGMGEKKEAVLPRMFYAMSMANNAYLYSLRQRQNLSLREAAKKTHLPSLLLSLYEKGYLPIPKAFYPTLAIAYGVSVDSFNDVLDYPALLDEKKDPSPKSKKLTELALKWPTLITVFALFGICLGVFLWGYIDFFKIGSSTDTAYDSEIIQLDDLVRAKGEKNEEGDRYTLSYTAGDNSKLGIVSSNDKRLAAATNFAYVFPQDNENITITLSASASDMIFSFTEGSALLSTYTGSGRIENNHYVLTNLLDDNEEAVTDESVIKTKQSLISSYEDKTEPLYVSWRGANSFNGTKSPNALVQAIAEANGVLAVKLSLANNLLLYGTLFGAIFFFLSIVLGAFKFVSAKKKKVYTLTESVPDLPSRNPKPLAPNFRFTPFIPETFFRLAGIVMILISSILFFQVAKTAIAGIQSQDLLALILAADEAMSWYQLMPLIPLATTLWFFIRIEVLHTTENVWPTILLSLFLGFLYYFAENAFLFYFQMNSDVYRTLLLSAFFTFMPGNLFWGMAAFSTIILFLLTTPKFKKPHTVIIWRLCALIPVAYLLFSYFYSVGTDLWNWPKWDDDVSGLLARKQAVQTLFALLYPFLIYLYRIIAVHRYGKERATLYFQGNRYFFIKNLLACIILGILALVSYFYGATPVGKSLGLKGAYWIAVLIPFILFYHPHMGQRNKILDALFPLAYTISITFAYLYLARFLLFFTL